MGPEHAQIIAKAGWSKWDVKRFLWENFGKTKGELRRFGKVARDLEDNTDAVFIYTGGSPIPAVPQTRSCSSSREPITLASPPFVPHSPLAGLASVTAPARYDSGEINRKLRHLARSDVQKQRP
jgi:hypothetical protein